MVNKTELAIICTFAGVVIGIFISSVVFFCFRWYKRRSDFENHNTENRPVRNIGNGVGLDSSASFSDSVVVPLPDLPAKSLPPLWLNHHNKDRTTSVSGIPKYLYK